ncbi:MAG: sulfite oxidase heme-binding subunit YedZ [Anaerolineaceae bacterium]
MTASLPAAKNIRSRRSSLIRTAVVAAAWLPALWMIWTYFFAPVSIDPVQYLERFSGQVAIIILIASLACTPLTTYLQFRDAATIRKPLGLFAFFYSAIHFLIYSGLDFLFDLQYLGDDVFTKAYLLVGLLALIILLPLAATSFKPVKKAMGRNWRRLHSLVYLINILVVLHYSWAKKGNLWTLSGEQLFPFISGLVVILLLVLRLPFVKRGFLRLKAVLSSPRRTESSPEPKITACSDCPS